MELHSSTVQSSVSTDVGSQKCRLGQEMLLHLDASLGSYILLHLPEASYVCSVWPHLMHPEGSQVQYDGSVSLRPGHHGTELSDDSVSLRPGHHGTELSDGSVSLRPGHHGTELSDGSVSLRPGHHGTELPETRSDSSSCRIEALPASDATTVTVMVVVQSIEKCLQWKKLQTVKDTLKRHCLNCLRKTCVVEKCSVDVRTLQLAKAYGVRYVDVISLSTKQNTTGGIVRETTEVVIDAVQSAERYVLSRQISTRSVVGGMGRVAEDLKDLLILPLEHSLEFKKLGLARPKGILLRGPPGCGKTSLIRDLAQKCRAVLVTINGPEILSPNPGESEQNVRELFQKATRLSLEGPCILFIDEIDSVCPRRGKTGSSNNSHVTSAIMSAMDALTSKDYLIVIGATNRPSALDPSIRRPGRFDREVLMNVPNRDQRLEILSIHSRRLPLSEDVDLDLLADLTNGYVGADLASLCNEAAYCAMGEAPVEQTASPHVSMSHFLSAVHTVVPSLQKGVDGVVTLQHVQWEDIGGLDAVKDQIKQAVEWPMLYPEAFTRMGIPAPKGVLLYGPPGCCKTTLVRAAATTTRATFLALSGAQLYSPFVGDSEQLIAEVFQKARAMAPTILFLDEIDSIVGKRSQGKGHRGVQERVLSALLNEMDGIGIRLDDKTDSVHRDMEAEGDRKDQGKTHQTHCVENNRVLVVAATNRPDLVDDAILRPGRIDRIVYVPSPDEETRFKILKIQSRKMPLDFDVDLRGIAQRTEFYTGADLENLCKEAAMCSLTEDMESTSVLMKHFLRSLDMVKPSLSQQLVEKYKKLGDRYQRHIPEKLTCIENK